MTIDSPIITGSIQSPLNLTSNISASGAITGSGFFTTGSIVVMGNITASSARFSNIVTAQTLVVQVVSSSTEYASGSNIFGNQLTNTHQFTGSMFVTASTVAFIGSNVGVGIANPSVDLEVLNTIKSRTQVYIGNNSANSFLQFQTGGSTNYAGNIFTNSNTDILNINGGSASSYDSGSSIGLIGADRYGTKTAGMLVLSAGNAVNNTAYGFISMNTGNLERMRITYAGYVGIGTSSPNYALVISSSNAGGNRVQITPTTTYAFFQIDNSAGTTYIGTDNSTGGVFGNGAYAMSIYNSYAGNIALYTNAALRMHISSSGNVGIGTNTQTNTLQVNGNIKFGVLGLVRNTLTTLTGNSTSGDVFRLLDSNGGLLGAGTICGTLYIVAFDTATGGNQVQYQYTWLSGGNGTGNATFTQTSSNLRGTNPLPSISMVNDGAGGGTKITGTSAASGVSGANVWVTFIGTVQ